VIGKSPASSRQLASRARRQLDERRPRFASSAERQRELAGKFFDAVEDGDLSGLESLLADDVVLRGDGGGKVPALARALHGRTRAAKALRNWAKVGAAYLQASLDRVELNGLPGAIMRTPDGRVLGAFVIETDGERITAINSIVNPEKIDHLGEGADCAALLRKGRG